MPALQRLAAAAIIPRPKNAAGLTTMESSSQPDNAEALVKHTPMMQQYVRFDLKPVSMRVPKPT